MPKGPPEGYRRAGATGGGSMGASGGGRGGGRGGTQSPKQTTTYKDIGGRKGNPRGPEGRPLRLSDMRPKRPTKKQMEQAAEATKAWNRSQAAKRGAQTRRQNAQAASTPKPPAPRGGGTAVKGAVAGAAVMGLTAATAGLLNKAAQEKKNPPSAPSKVKPQQGMRKTLGGVRAIYDKGRWIPLADYNRKTSRN